jgi:hypothetical protein
MSAADIQGTLTFDPIDGGTRMGWLRDLRLRGWYRLLTPVIARSGQRLEQATWASLEQDLEGQRDRVRSHAEVLRSRGLLGWGWSTGARATPTRWGCPPGPRHRWPTAEPPVAVGLPLVP